MSKLQTFAKGPQLAFELREPKERRPASYSIIIRGMAIGGELSIYHGQIHHSNTIFSWRNDRENFHYGFPKEWAKVLDQCTDIQNKQRFTVGWQHPDYFAFAQEVWICAYDSFDYRYNSPHPHDYTVDLVRRKVSYG